MENFKNTEGSWKLVLILFFVIFNSSFVKSEPFSQSSLYLNDKHKDFLNSLCLRTSVSNNKNAFVRLSSTPWGFYPSGIFLSHPIKLNFPAKEIYPSWNIICPENKCGFRVYIRVSPDGSFWSSWFYMGRWGVCPSDKNKIIKDSIGNVEIDSLFLKKEALYIQYSLYMFSPSGRHTPELRLFACSYGNRACKKHNYTCSPGSVIKLKVPYRSQGDEDRSISGQICSPTCVAMLMEYWGVDIPTSEIARLCYDEEYELYGSWPMAVQSASQYGFKGWIHIFKGWQEVEKQLLLGRPVIATICFDKGELKGSCVSDTDGHVVLITGFDEKGNPICNDPGWNDESDGILTYDRQEFGHAWFDNSGIGYIIFR